MFWLFLKILFHQWVFFSINFFIGPIVVLIPSNRPLFDRVDLLKNSSRSKTIGPWSSWSSDDLVRVLTLRRHYARPSVETGRGYTKAPEGGRDNGTFRGPSDDQYDHGPTFLIGYCFSTCLKTVADYFFWYLGGLRDRVRSSPEGIIG